MYKRWSTCGIVSMFESGRCPNERTMRDNRRPPVKLYESFGKGVGMHPADIQKSSSSHVPRRHHRTWCLIVTVIFETLPLSTV